LSPVRGFATFISINGGTELHRTMDMEKKNQIQSPDVSQRWLENRNKPKRVKVLSKLL